MVISPGPQDASSAVVTAAATAVSLHDNHWLLLLAPGATWPFGWAAASGVDAANPHHYAAGLDSIDQQILAGVQRASLV